MEILESNIKRLSPEGHKKYQWVFNEYLKHLSSEDTITFSNMFIAKATK